MNEADRVELEKLRLEMIGRMADVLTEVKLTNERLVNFQQRFEKALDSVSDTQKDHEARIRLVEKWKFGLPLSMVLVAISVMAGIVGRGHF